MVMLKLELNKDLLKNLVLQHYFKRDSITPPEIPGYEAYFIIDKDGEPLLVIEEAT